MLNQFSIHAWRLSWTKGSSPCFKSSPERHRAPTTQHVGRKKTAPARAASGELLGAPAVALRAELAQRLAAGVQQAKGLSWAFCGKSLVGGQLPVEIPVAGFFTMKDVLGRSAKLLVTGLGDNQPMARFYNSAEGEL